MTFTYYYRLIVNPHKDKVIGYPICDDSIYLKSESQIEVLSDEFRVFSDCSANDSVDNKDHNPPKLERITAIAYQEAQERAKKVLEQLSKK